MGITNNTLSLSFKTLFLNLLAATVVLSPLTALKPASSESITVDNLKADLIAQVGAEIPIDPVEIKDMIDEAVYSSENRGGFVKGLMEAGAVQAKKGGYNVMVFNLQQDYDTDIRNTAEYFKRVEYDGIPYGIWIFEKGTFTNKGDGGWINWGFYGNFERDGKTVTFR